MEAPRQGAGERSPEGGTGWRTYEPVQLPKILDVALAQIVEHGYDATSVRTIAREVGVTVPALYYHYENKQALLVALLDHAMTIVTAHVEAALAEAGDDPVTRLGAMVEAVALYAAHHRDLAFIDIERRALTPAHRARYVEQRDRIEHPLREVIAAGCAAGVFRTPYPDTAARAILAMCQGIATWYSPDGPDTPEEIARRYVQLAAATVQSTTVPSTTVPSTTV